MMKVSEKISNEHDSDSVGRKLLVPLIPYEVARKYRVIPWDVQSKVLTVALEDAGNWKVLDMLRFKVGLEIKPLQKDAAEIDKLLDLYYPREKTVLQELSDDLQKEGQKVIRHEDGLLEPKAHQLSGPLSQAPVVRWVNRILEEALRVKASDIHFESCEKSFRVRFRRDGALYELESLSKEMAQPVITRLKVMASLDISETRLPQDGRIQVENSGKTIDLRVSTLPTFCGESVVIRVLDQSSVSLCLSDLGFSQPIIQNLRTLLHKPHGMILVTGPTGSGKTTTLYACLAEVDRQGLKVITVEDPVEYEHPGIVQIPVHEKTGLSFAKVLRAILRHDPDIVMIGEIRDEETAKIAVQAALTGHLVLTTLHTNDAPGAVTRLMEMGIEPYLIASSLKGVLAQRLMRKICPECRLEIPAGSEILKSFPEFHTPNARVFESKGCKDCHGFGYLGRVAIGEFFAMSPAIQTLIADGTNPAKLILQAEKEGLVPLRRQAEAKVSEGISSLNEYLHFRAMTYTKKGALK